MRKKAQPCDTCGKKAKKAHLVTNADLGMLAICGGKSIESVCKIQAEASQSQIRKKDSLSVNRIYTTREDTCEPNMQDLGRSQPKSDRQKSKILNLGNAVAIARKMAGVTQRTAGHIIGGG